MSDDRSVVFAVQKLLKVYGNGTVDQLTSAAIRNYQLKNQLYPSGIIDQTLLDHLNIGIPDMYGTTDLSEARQYIKQYHLPTDEYIPARNRMEYVFLHHTAGWNNPYRTVDNWRNDDRGRIATQFVIGGQHPQTGDQKYDGLILETFPDHAYGWHLGRVDKYMHTHSVGIELCSLGYADKKGGRYFAYTGTEIDKRYIIDLGYKFRGKQYWIKYSDMQLATLKNLLNIIAERFNIDLHSGLYNRLETMEPAQAFEFSDAAKQGKTKGLLSHTSVRTDKFDVFPQPELLDMIRSL